MAKPPTGKQLGFLRGLRRELGLPAGGPPPATLADASYLIAELRDRLAGREDDEAPEVVFPTWEREIRVAVGLHDLVRTGARLLPSDERLERARLAVVAAIDRATDSGVSEADLNALLSRIADESTAADTAADTRPLTHLSPGGGPGSDGVDESFLNGMGPERSSPLEGT